MKIAIVPDVHCRTFWKDIFSIINEVEKVVFLGDYVDPYPDEEGLQSPIDSVMQIVEFKRSNPKKVVLLWGNHEGSYHFGLSCSRYDRKNAPMLSRLFESYKNEFQLAYEKKGYLFTHAGLNATWYENIPEVVIPNPYSNPGTRTLDPITKKPLHLRVHDLLNREWLCYPYLKEVGPWRWGTDAAGSCVWADVREFDESYPEFYQIFGHTQLSKPYIGKSCACLDCRQIFVLGTNTGKILTIDEFKQDKQFDQLKDVKV